jgi:3-isopropylmalate/(R)-2-methylmalate dehydratase small subunit
MAGLAWRLGDNVDNDAIIPAPYLNLSMAEVLDLHCLEGLSPAFAREVRPRGAIVAGGNFGCGSSRERAPLAIKGCGMARVIAKSFARIFYRNAINAGLPIVEHPQVVEETQQGDPLEVDLEGGRIANLRTGRTYLTPPFPPFILGIIAAGGLIP